MKTTTTYPKNTISVNAKYACECGHKFVRKNSDWFTMNPFNKKTFEQCANDIENIQSNRKRPCPKCESECTPINT